MEKKRLDKLLADSGVASRRELREIIRSGRVYVDGRAVTRPEQKIDGESSVITLDGVRLRCEAYRYYMMDKPVGILSATEDRRQKTVLDFLPPELKRMNLFPVGRLDKDTSGLLLLTNDGDFSHRVISPKSLIEKRYAAEVDGIPDDEDVLAFKAGIILSDGTVCMPARLEITGTSLCFVTVMEGKYHQVRRMLASRGKPVLTLRRLSVGDLVLESEKPGEIQELFSEDLCKVFRNQLLDK